MRTVRALLVGVVLATAVSLVAQSNLQAPPVTITTASAVNGAGQVTSALTFVPDNTFSLGAVGATRPINIYAANRVDAATKFSMSDVLFLHGSAPVATTFCTSPSVPNANGTAAFTINVGTSCATSVGVITLASATTGWHIECQNITSNATSVIGQTGGTQTTALITNYVRTTGVAGNWTDSWILRCSALGY